MLFSKKILQKVIKNNSIITNNLSSSQKGVKQINKINNQKKKSKSKESKEEQPMIETGSSEIIKDLKVNQDMNIKFKEFLTNYVRNEFSIYPEIKGTKCGETKLQDIYNFLHSEILTPNNKKWPKYIEEAIAHNKQLQSQDNNLIDSNENDIKLRRSDDNKELITNKLYYIKNMKKEFRMSAKSYKLTEKGDLIYLRNFKEKDKLTKKWVKKP